VKAIKPFLVLAALMSMAANLTASGPLAIYATVEKVIFEPNEQAAERIQIWGAFSFVDGGIRNGRSASPPQHGYLYLSVPPRNTPSERDAIKKEWADLKAVAGTDEVVAFGDWGTVGGRVLVQNHGPARPPQRGESGPYPVELRVLTESPVRAEPVPYSINTGVVKVSRSVNNSELIEQLKALVKK
jgi:hypothetical protein